jgi:hypothetical protein
MQLSAEIRFFWSNEKPTALESWFMDQAVHRCPAGGGKLRADVYLLDEKQIELGVKTRGDKPGVEVKGLVATLGNAVEFNAHEISIEFWSKWPSQALGFDSAAGVTLHKKRWLRKFDTTNARVAELTLDPDERVVGGSAMPGMGCNVEWTIVDTPGGETCWTLGFEAFGHLQDVENSLRSVVRIMRERKPPLAPGAMATSYPEWIAKRFSK